MEGMGARVGRPPASRRRNRLLSQPRPPPSVPLSTLAPPRIHCRRPSASRRSSPPRIRAHAMDLGDSGSEPQCTQEVGSAPPRRHTGWGRPPA
jgi:hypothetical protein